MHVNISTTIRWVEFCYVVIVYGTETNNGERLSKQQCNKKPEDNGSQCSKECTWQLNICVTA